MPNNILITGLPRSGKTTLLKDVISQYPRKVGFLTNEVCDDTRRIGFDIELSSGEKSMFARINFRTDHKVSRYYVDIEALDSMIDKITEFSKEDLLYIDEIGQMELFSDKFKQLALKYIDSDNICIATLSSVHEDAFIERVKKRSDIIIVEMSEQNRAEKQEFIKTLLRDLIKDGS